MSTLWTPSGEQPVGRAQEPPPSATEPSEEELADELREVTEELARTPASVVVANHAMGLFELAALHLSQQPPNLAEAQVAIDAMAALVEGLGDRFGPNAGMLRDALAQLRLAFVQLKGGAEG